MQTKEIIKIMLVPLTLSTLCIIGISYYQHTLIMKQTEQSKTNMKYNEALYPDQYVNWSKHDHFEHANWDKIINNKVLYDYPSGYSSIKVSDGYISKKNIGEGVNWQVVNPTCYEFRNQSNELVEQRCFYGQSN